MSDQTITAAERISMYEDQRTFVRVYRLPKKLTNWYCFGQGVPITFLATIRP